MLAPQHLELVHIDLPCGNILCAQGASRGTLGTSPPTLGTGTHSTPPRGTHCSTLGTQRAPLGGEQQIADFPHQAALGGPLFPIHLTFNQIGGSPKFLLMCDMFCSCVICFAHEGLLLLFSHI